VLEFTEELGVFVPILFLVYDWLSRENEFRFTLVKGDKSSSMGSGNDVLAEAESGLGVLAVG
jgi:hypothetical protein